MIFRRAWHLVGGQVKVRTPKMALRQVATTLDRRSYKVTCNQSSSQHRRLDFEALLYLGFSSLMAKIEGYLNRTWSRAVVDTAVCEMFTYKPISFHPSHTRT